MQTNIESTKISDMVSNTINTMMVALGTITIISVLAFLIATVF